MPNHLPCDARANGGRNVCHFPNHYIQLMLQARPFGGYPPNEGIGRIILWQEVVEPNLHWVAGNLDRAAVCPEFGVRHWSAPCMKQRTADRELYVDDEVVRRRDEV